MRPADLGRPDVAMPGSDIARPSGPLRAATTCIWDSEYRVQAGRGRRFLRCRPKSRHPVPLRCTRPSALPLACPRRGQRKCNLWLRRLAGSARVRVFLFCRRRRPRWVRPSHRTRSYRYQVISFRFQCPPGEALIGSKGCCPGRLSKIVSTRTSVPYFAVFHGPSEQSGCPPTYDLLIS